MAGKSKTVTVSASMSEYKAISAAAKAARMSRSAWMLQAAEEKLARDGAATEAA